MGRRLSFGRFKLLSTFFLFNVVLQIVDVATDFHTARIMIDDPNQTLPGKDVSSVGKDDEDLQ